MGCLMILIQVLDPFPLLEHARFDMIPLSEVVNSKVPLKELIKTYPCCLLAQEGPQTISNGGRIPHRPSRRIKGTIPRPWVHYSMTKQLIQHPPVGGQCFPLQTKITIKSLQGHQGLVPDDIVQRTPRCPR